MKTTAAKALFAAAPAFALGAQESPIVQGLPYDKWSTVDFLIGFGWGLYVPARSYTSDFDCLSGFLNFGDFILKEQTYFDRAPDTTWVGYAETGLTWFKITSNTYNLYVDC